MNVLKIKGETGKSSIIVGEKLQNLHKYIDTENIIVITDENVNKLYCDKFNSACFPNKENHELKLIEIRTGEKIKTLKTVEEIINKLILMGADRSTFLIGIGGGIVCDITGFVASIFLRGINFGFVSTTLLSQIDASSGGKNGVNYIGYKNMIGTFNQPNFVICDPKFLKTVSKQELRSGFAEMIKHAVIRDIGHFEYIENNYSKAIRLDKDVIEKLIYDSVSIKVNVVKKDEKEKGERKILNFGHTVGHAVESSFGILHGEAVSFGMSIAADISVYFNLLSEEESLRIKRLLKCFNLPTTLTEVKKLSQKGTNNGLDIIKEAISHDKKKNSDTIDFILLTSIGKAIIKKIKISELNEILDILLDENKKNNV